MNKLSSGYEKRKGVLPISWTHFHSLCKGLALAVDTYQPELILPVGRGGYYPGTLIAHILQVDIYPVRVSRRVNDVVTFPTPRWIVEPPAAVKGRRVLIVDEISGSGETLTLVKQRVVELGAQSAKTAVLYAHSNGVETPDYIGLISDALFPNPWDREVLHDGAFRFHPEYVGALALQGVAAESTLLIQAPAANIAKP